MRRPRLELPGVPLHITQRGVNRAAVFLDDEDCAGYLQAIETASGDNDEAQITGTVRAITAIDGLAPMLRLRVTQHGLEARAAQCLLLHYVWADGQFLAVRS